MASAPGSRSDEKENKEVTGYFLKFFKDQFRQENPVSLAALKLTDQNLLRMGAEGKDPISVELADLERYCLAAHLRLKDLQSAQALKERCCAHDLKKFHSRWTAYQVEEGGADTLFFTEPDLVDFVFDTHLHRYIRHPRYDHHIIQGDDGRAQLLHDQKYTSWQKIKRLLGENREELIDLAGNPSYQYAGFATNQKLHCFDTLKTPPEESQLQIVVAMLSSDYNCLQRPCQGGEHSFCRLILGTKMQGRAGEVYSFGFFPKAIPSFTLLNSFAGGLYSPDFLEFSKQTLRIGTCDLLPQQAETLLEALKTQRHNSFVFNALHDNCHGNLIAFLHAQGILLDLDIQEPLSSIVYRTFLPQSIQNTLNFLFSYIPKSLQKIYRVSLDFFTSLLILTPLGSWFHSETVEKAVFEKIADVIDPTKAYCSTAARIIAWQDLHDPQVNLFA